MPLLRWRNNEKRRTTLQIFAKIFLSELPLQFHKCIRVQRRIGNMFFFFLTDLFCFSFRFFMINLLVANADTVLGQNVSPGRYSSRNYAEATV